MGIREMREARRMSRKAFSNQIGYAEVTVGRWERGERTPNGKALRIMSDALQCSSDDLIRGNPTPPRPPIPGPGANATTETEDLKATA
jgi:transcriptional regulator with XRE-family HTH domain